MLKQIEKDILTIKSGLLVHQTNCQAVFGSGIAKQIRDKYPEVFEQYKNFCRSVNIDDKLLGRCQITNIKDNPKLQIVNIFGQLYYGRTPNMCYTIYWAVDNAFALLKAMTGAKEIYVPYLMGCGLAGGDWKQYSAIIEKHFPDAVVCKLPENKK